MTIVAIDPGPIQSAYVILEDGRILHYGIMKNAEMLELMKACQSHHCVIEMIASYGMAVGAEVFETCVWIGRFIQAWESRTGTTPCRIKRKEVCLHLCGSSRAKDANIRAALIDRFGPAGTKKEPGGTYGISKDVWAALAVAVTAYDTMECC